MFEHVGHLRRHFFGAAATAAVMITAPAWNGRVGGRGIEEGEAARDQAGTGCRFMVTIADVDLSLPCALRG